MEAALVLFGLYFVVTSARNRAAVRFGEGQTAAYGRAICELLSRKATAHTGRSEPHGQTRAADEPELVSWGQVESFSDPREQGDTSKEVMP